MKAGALIGTLVASAGVLLACNNSAVQPRVQVRPSADFVSAHLFLGDVPWHSEIPFNLEFCNFSEQPVRIAAVQESCACTHVNAEEIIGHELAPQDAVIISGVVRAGERLGQHRETVDVMLDSGIVRTARLDYGVLASYEVRPLDISFETVDLEAASARAETKTVLFASKGARLVNVSRSVPWITTATHDLNDEETEIILGLRPQFLSVGLNEGQVLVETDDAGRRHQPVSVRVEALASIRVVPQHLFLRSGEARTVFLLDAAGERIPVAGVRLDGSSPHIEHAINEDGTVTIHFSGRGDESEATVTLVTPNGRSASLRAFRMD